MSAEVDIPNGWSYRKLVDCTEDGVISYGIVQPGKHIADGVPIIRVNNIKDGQLQLNDVHRVAPEVASKYRRTSLKGGEVLLTLVGSTGQSTVAGSDVAGWNVARAIAVIRPTSDIGSRWINICLQVKSAKHFLDTRANTTVQKTLNLKDVKDVPILLPPRNVRLSIESVASNLDNKIQLNHRINQTLEQMAQALFKSWFVDFEPVKAKVAALEAGGSDEDALLAAMEAVSGKTADQLATLSAEQPERYAELRATAELFPSAMQDSELGEIPEGWEATSFGAVSTCFDKNRIPLSKRQREQRQGKIPYYGATSVMDYVDDFLFDDIYLLLGEDGSVIRDDGTPYTQYIWGKAWVNNHAHVLQGENGVSTEQLMLFISSLNISAYVTGAVQLKLNQKNMNSIPFIKAHNELNARFYDLVAPMYEEQRILTDENEALAKLRDTLLPKLLSGELTLPDADETPTEPQDVAYV